MTLIEPVIDGLDFVLLVGHEALFLRVPFPNFSDGRALRVLKSHIFFNTIIEDSRVEFWSHGCEAFVFELGYFEPPVIVHAGTISSLAVHAVILLACFF